MIALALLANDRNRVLKDPVKYMQEEKHPFRNLSLVFVAVVLVIGVDTTADALFMLGVLTEKISLLFRQISYGFRVTYLCICLF